MHPLRLLFALLSSAAFISAPAAPQDIPSITVSGRVYGMSNETPRTLIVNECDICDKSRRCFVELDSTGGFEVDIPFYYGHTFTVNFNRSLFVNAYAEPGDSIVVSIDASKSPIEFHLAGNHAGLNEEYSHAVCDLAPIYYEVTLPPDTVPLSVYMPKFKGEVARTQAIVERYIEEKSLLPETAELLRLDNIFIPANQAIGFRGSGIDEQTAFFTDSVFDIFNERNAKVMIFPYHLSALANKNQEYVGKMPKSIIRDLMYAAMGDEQKPSRSDFANLAYYDRLYSDTTGTVDFSGLKPGRIVIMENNTVSDIADVNPVEWLKKRFSSRPVYLDVSATWCGPCRAALSGSEDVRHYLKDTDVVFAIIWLKSDMESWMAFAPKIHNAIHVFIPEEDMSNRIMGLLNLQGFPSYCLIERNGDISTENVPHYNDPQLADYLRNK